MIGGYILLVDWLLEYKHMPYALYAQLSSADQKELFDEWIDFNISRDYTGIGGDDIG